MKPLDRHTGAVLSVGFSPDGTRIMSGSDDTTIYGMQGQVMKPLNEHTGAVWSVGFSPDGTRIVSGSGDKTIRIWEQGQAPSLSRETPSAVPRALQMGLTSCWPLVTNTGCNKDRQKGKASLDPKSYCNQGTAWTNCLSI